MKHDASKKTNSRAKVRAKRYAATPAQGPLDPLLPPPYGRMTAAEMDAVAAEFDHEILAEQLKPLTWRMKRLDDALRGRGRPRVGKGAKRINLTMELDLLRRVDSLAARSGKSRSQIIARGVMDFPSKGAVAQEGGSGPCEPARVKERTGGAAWLRQTGCEARGMSGVG